MKGHGLLAGMIIGVLVLTTFASAKDVSIFDTERNQRERKFGIEITGGGNIFALDDVNNYFLTPVDNIVVNSYTDAQMGIGGGLALLYRSHDDFRWQIGYNYLGQDSFTGSFTNTDDGTTATNENAISGSELYVAGNYMWVFGDALHLYFGAGIGIITAKLDRITSQSEFSPAIYNANGRAFGGRLQAGAEFMLTHSFGFTGMVGYHLANVGNLKYEDLTGAQDEFGAYPTAPLVWDANNNDTRKIAVDFSGPFAELGIRVYFEDATGWYQP